MKRQPRYSDWLKSCIRQRRCAKKGLAPGTRVQLQRQSAGGGVFWALQLVTGWVPC